MKLLLFLAFLVTFCACQTQTLPRSYQAVNLTTISTDPLLLSILNFGIDEVTDLALKNGDLRVHNLTLVLIYSLYYRDGDPFAFYQYDVQLSDYAGTTSHMVFRVRYNKTSGEMAVVQKDYTVNTLIFDPKKAPFKNLTTSFAQTDPLLQSILEYGYNRFITLEMGNGVVPASDYVITDLILIQKQLQLHGANYRCYIALEDNNEIRIEYTFIIYAEQFTNELSFVNSSYYVTTYSTVTGTVHLPAGMIVPDGYYVVDPDSLSTNAEALIPYNFGVPALLDAMKKANIIKTSTSNFRVENVNAVFRQVVDGINYQFAVDIVNDNGTLITTAFKVIYMPVNGSLELDFYNYVIKTITIPNWGIYVPISTSRATTDPTLNSIMNYGIQSVLATAYARGNAPYSVYTVSKVVSLYKQAFYSTQNYKFSLTLKNALNGTFSTNFTMNYNLATYSMAINGYYYYYTGPRK